MWTRNDLVTAFRSLGLAAGDLVLVHSALRKLGEVEGGADTVLDALLETVGPRGTLALPTHTWKIVNAEQPVFHQVLSPSNVGAMTNVFRLRPGVVRGLHPTHSIAATGPRAAQLVAGHERDHTPCSPTSPYGRLRDWGGKILIIGPGLECCTFFHGCEEWTGMPWAVSPKPVQLYSITAAGEIIPVSLHHHVTSTWPQYPSLESGLVAAGALTLGRLGECSLRLLDARAAAEHVMAQLRSDPTIVLPNNMR